MPWHLCLSRAPAKLIVVASKPRLRAALKTLGDFSIVAFRWVWSASSRLLSRRERALLVSWDPTTFEGEPPAFVDRLGNVSIHSRTCPGLS